MRLLENKRYRDTLEKVYSSIGYWNSFRNKSFMFSGATGMIGSFIIDLLEYADEIESLGLRIIALGRSKEKAQQRFREYFGNDNFRFIEYSLYESLSFSEPVDYVFHLASSTHPLQYSTDPIGTLLSNIEGLKNLLEFSAGNSVKRVVFASSVEIYGENRGDVEKFDESYMGYVDCNAMRACYTEGKRAAEALCQAYIAQKKLDIVIPRISRVYGPTMLQNDSKAIAQFLRNSISRNDIVLKSEGTQLFSYGYVADVASAILYILHAGNCGEAYNICSHDSDITLRNLASLIAECNGRKVVFELPDEKEARGYSKATKALLDTSKLESLGWTSLYSIKDGIEDTVSILGDIW